MTEIGQKIIILLAIFFTLIQNGQLCPQFAMAYPITNESQHQNQMTPKDNIFSQTNHHEPIPYCCLNDLSHFDTIIDSKIIDNYSQKLLPGLSTSNFLYHLPINYHLLNSSSDGYHCLNPINYKSTVKRE